MTKELLKRKIQIFKEDLAMLTEGSVASDSLAIEIEDLKRQLKAMEEAENVPAHKG
jgi:hypothetical protein